MLLEKEKELGAPPASPTSQVSTAAAAAPAPIHFEVPGARPVKIVSWSRGLDFAALVGGSSRPRLTPVRPKMLKY